MKMAIVGLTCYCQKALPRLQSHFLNVNVEAGIMIKNAHYRDEYTEKPVKSREGAGSQRCNF